jgi:2-iminobutanoate/2-iminopropanoate deaminase
LPDFATPYGVAAAVLAGDLIFISGQAPVNRQRQIVGTTLEAQTRVALDAFTVVLTEAQSSWDDVVKLTAFVTVDGVEAMETYFRVMNEYLAQHSKRSSVGHTYVVAKTLVFPEVLIEIEGVAVKRRRSS